MSEYICLNSDELKKKIGLLLNLWETFLDETVKTYITECKELKVPSEQMDVKELYSVNIFSLSEVFERTHQREDYFDRYHKKLIMSNYKEIGLIAFWITKLKPFRLNMNYFEGFFDAKINEQFAIYFIFSAIAQYAEKKGRTYNLINIDSEIYNEILYTMQYRDLSKEAYGCIVELIAAATTSK